MTIDIAVLGLFITISIFVIGILMRISNDNKKAHTIIHEKINAMQIGFVERIATLEAKINGKRKK